MSLLAVSPAGSRATPQVFPLSRFSNTPDTKGALNSLHRQGLCSHLRRSGPGWVGALAPGGRGHWPQGLGGWTGLACGPSPGRTKKEALSPVQGRWSQPQGIREGHWRGVLAEVGQRFGRDLPEVSGRGWGATATPGARQAPVSCPSPRVCRPTLPDPLSGQRPECRALTLLSCPSDDGLPSPPPPQCKAGGILGSGGPGRCRPARTSSGQEVRAPPWEPESSRQGCRRTWVKGSGPPGDR